MNSATKSCQLSFRTGDIYQTTSDLITLVCSSLALVGDISRRNISVKHYVRRGTSITLDITLSSTNVDEVIHTIGSHIVWPGSPLHTLPELKSIFTGATMHVLEDEIPNVESGKLTEWRVNKMHVGASESASRLVEGSPISPEHRRAESSHPGQLHELSMNVFKAVSIEPGKGISLSKPDDASIRIPKLSTEPGLSIVVDAPVSRLPKLTVYKVPTPLILASQPPIKAPKTSTLSAMAGECTVIPQKSTNLKLSRFSSGEILPIVATKMTDSGIQTTDRVKNILSAFQVPRVQIIKPVTPVNALKVTSDSVFVQLPRGPYLSSGTSTDGSSSFPPTSTHPMRFPQNTFTPTAKMTKPVMTCATIYSMQLDPEQEVSIQRDSECVTEGDNPPAVPGIDVLAEEVDTPNLTDSPIFVVRKSAVGLWDE